METGTSNKFNVFLHKIIEGLRVLYGNKKVKDLWEER